MSSKLSTGTILAGFRVQSFIGEGGMGAVYLAEDMRRGGRVALKLLAPELARDERFRQRFLRESQLASSVHHPHIVPIRSAGAEGDALYLAMEYVEGSDLRELLSGEGRLEPQRAIELVRQVAGALDSAHAAGLIHRDVKPGNILVTVRPDGERAYVCDFGVARHVSSVSSLTGDRGFVGTIDYVPPEQIEGGAIDARADVYSLGCVLFECLAGARPFDRESELAVVFAHLNEPPPVFSDLRPELPNAFDNVFQTALAKSPDDRYSTCRELVAAASAARQGRTFVRRKLRRRRMFLSGTAVLAVAVGGAIGGILAWQNEPPPAGPPSISQTAIAGARLGQSATAYKQRFGSWREDIFVLPNFRTLIFQQPKVAVYFERKVDAGIIITTWNHAFRTATGIRPCSTIQELKSAYGSKLRPSKFNTQKGKVYAYTVGKNLLFAANGPPPNPSKYVTAVALYDGSAPGANKPHGSLPFAGFVALNETNCR